MDLQYIPLHTLPNITVLIETHNAKENTSFTLGHNGYSDMTHAEFRSHMKLDNAGLTIPSEGRTFNFMEYNTNDSNKVEEIVGNSKLRGPAEAAIQRKLEASTEDDANNKVVDWHEKGLMGPIRNQGVCGACWAFSAIGSIESAMAIDKYNKMTPNQQENLMKNSSADGADDLKNDLGLVVPLSEQDLIDCDTMYEKGCQGGL